MFTSSPQGMISLIDTNRVVACRDSLCCQMRMKTKIANTRFTALTQLDGSPTLVVLRYEPRNMRTNGCGLNYSQFVVVQTDGNIALEKSDLRCPGVLTSIA